MTCRVIAYPGFNARARYHEALDLIADPTVNGDAKLVYLEVARGCWRLMIAERHLDATQPNGDA
jgi:hypothetical protein